MVVAELMQVTPLVVLSMEAVVAEEAVANQLASSLVLVVTAVYLVEELAVVEDRSMGLLLAPGEMEPEEKYGSQNFLRSERGKTCDCK